jgi:protein tyrosine phosphatase (PTP) superfamily phosphohydrolase (DUF442 family)
MIKRRPRLAFVHAIFAAALLALPIGQDGPVALHFAATAPAEPWRPERIDESTLPNAYRLHERVISGGQPDGESAFAALKELGIKTIISVDGAKPDVELAKRHGLRYVHLPHGYDGVPEQRAKELAKAVRDLPGPIYIHCHHGHHRSPAAATVACVGAGLLSHDNALAVLKTAGTSDNYRGLYQSAESAKQLDEALLDALQVEFPETVKVPPIADAMTDIEHTHDHLKSLSANRWRKLAEQPDLDAAHEALLLREHYTELARTDDVRRQPAGFQKLLNESEATARSLETLLADWTKAGAADPPPAAIAKAFTAVTESCASCHQTYRDVPLGEKRK